MTQSPLRNIFYFISIIGGAHLSYQYLFFKLQIKSFNNHKNLSKKTKEQSNILQNLLPKHVLEKFLNNPEATRLELVDVFEDVTILFADIAGFTKYSSQVEPEQVVNMLKKLFYEFDKACQENDIFKLYTIGDCYVVIGFTDSRKRNPSQEAKNVLAMSFSMIEIIKDLRAQAKFDHLDMRIGVHTGRIIGGVIGTDIVRYDIYGRDVVIANKMESSGTQGRVLVSSQTRDLLENFGIYEFEEEKEVYCKSIEQTVKAYYVSYKKQDAQSDDFKGTISQYEEEESQYQDPQETERKDFLSNLEGNFTLAHEEKIETQEINKKLSIGIEEVMLDKSNRLILKQPKIHEISEEKENGFGENEEEKNSEQQQKHQSKDSSQIGGDISSIQIFNIKREAAQSISRNSTFLDEVQWKFTEREDREISIKEEDKASQDS